MPAREDTGVTSSWRRDRGVGYFPFRCRTGFVEDGHGLVQQDDGRRHVKASGFIALKPLIALPDMRGGHCHAVPATGRTPDSDPAAGTCCSQSFEPSVAYRCPNRRRMILIPAAHLHDERILFDLQIRPPVGPQIKMPPRFP